jgi:hypothetical protein
LTGFIMAIEMVKSVFTALCAQTRTIRIFLKLLLCNNFKKILMVRLIDNCCKTGKKTNQ